MRYKDSRSTTCWSSVGPTNLAAYFWIVWRTETFYELLSVDISVRTFVESWLIVDDLVRCCVFLGLIPFHLPSDYPFGSVSEIIHSYKDCWIVVLCRMSRFLGRCRDDMTTALHYARLEIRLVALWSIRLYLAMKITRFTSINHVGRVNGSNKIALVLCRHIFWIEVSNRCDLDVIWANILFFIAEQVVSIVISVLINLVHSWLLTPFRLVAFLWSCLNCVAWKSNLLWGTLLSESVVARLKLLGNWLLLSWVDLGLTFL